MSGVLPGGPGVLFGPGPASRWNSGRVSCPRVLLEADELLATWPRVLQLEDGSWRMCYHGIDRRQRYTMGWAESADRRRPQRRPLAAVEAT